MVYIQKDGATLLVGAWHLSLSLDILTFHDHVVIIISSIDPEVFACGSFSGEIVVSASRYQLL